MTCSSFWGGGAVHTTLSPSKTAIASSKIAWICGQCIFKHEGSKPGSCHFCQVPHQKRKAVVVPLPTPSSVLWDAAALAMASVLLAKPACICQPERSSSSVIDLSSPDAVLAVASVTPAKPACICQPARSFSSVIDLSAPGVALAMASVSPAKPVCIRHPARSSGSVIDLSTLDAVLLAGNVADMSATCRHDSQMSALLANMALSCRHKTDPDTTFLCRGWPTFTPFFFLYQNMYTQPAKNLYIRSLVYNTIEQLTTTTHNNQHEPWLGQRHHQLMVPPLRIGLRKACAVGLGSATVGSLVWGANASPIKK